MDIENFGQLLDEGKLEQAKAILKDYLKQPLTKVEEGGIHTAFLMAYMKAKNEQNREHLQVLNELSEQYKLLGQIEQGLDDASKLSDIREQLQ